jgi:hypothetical protein
MWLGVKRLMNCCWECKKDCSRCDNVRKMMNEKDEEKVATYIIFGDDIVLLYSSATVAHAGQCQQCC